MILYCENCLDDLPIDCSDEWHLKYICPSCERTTELIPSKKVPHRLSDDLLRHLYSSTARSDEQMDDVILELMERRGI